MSRSLAYLVDAVRADLGDVSGLFEDSTISRFLSEGQRKLEPDHLLEKSAALTFADNATSVALPSDYYEVTRIQAGSTSVTMPNVTHEHGGFLWFDPRDTVYAFTGTIFYRAHYPDFTATIPCVLPEAAVDGIISYALYKCYQRIGANRAEYRKYVTQTQNNTTMGDMLQAGNGHLADFNDVKTATGRPAPPAFYTDAE